MNLSFSSEIEDFRSEIRVFLEAYRDLDGFFGQGHKWPQVKALFRAMGDRGWLSMAWPEALGGANRGPEWEYVLWDEVAYARAARNPLSAGIVARSLIRCGTPAQQALWLPPIQSGELHFSLAYSEPEAGSDLAAVRVRADRDGEDYVIDGQKCWQSYAQDMDCFWLLARTGEPDSRARGLSLFICEKDRPGVTVRPLPTLDGDQLNEVHFDAVRLPSEHRVGPENGAWAIMAEALNDERHIQFPPGRVRRDLEEMTNWLEEAGLMSDPVVVRALTDLEVEVAEVEMHGLLVLDAMKKGRPAAGAVAANKVAHTLVSQRIARCVLDVGGPLAVVSGQRPELLWRQSLWETIGGGTTEIMRG
ncbi:MAG: acyl-CoA dehydrogenase family protein, partial [Myxococcota bacterium]